MASHHQTVVKLPRTLAHVLLDLQEARRDWEAAVADDDDDAADRASEADARIDDLRDEFAALFQSATGLTVRQIETAISEALL
jgi:hypothetical protein